MSGPNVDAVMTAVDTLLAGALDAEQMPIAIEQLRQLFDGSKACFARVGPNMKNGDAIGTNADQATGHEKVVVVALRLGGATEVGNRIAARLDEEIASLKAGGAEVRLVVPDEGSLAAMGVNLMDFRKRADAAAAGIAQGEAQASALKAFWAA